MQLQDENFHFSFSLAVLGEAAVGKSRMVRCTLPPPHDDDEEQDPAIDHGVRCRSHTYESRGARYQILMWEVPGAARYLESATRYATMAAGVLLVFDLTRRSTFERLPLWLEQARRPPATRPHRRPILHTCSSQVEAASPGLPRVVVGNKADGEPQVPLSPTPVQRISELQGRAGGRASGGCECLIAQRTTVTRRTLVRGPGDSGGGAGLRPEAQLQVL
jgi:GTPase SAR1 family protein